MCPVLWAVLRRAGYRHGASGGAQGPQGGKILSILSKTARRVYRWRLRVARRASGPAAGSARLRLRGLGPRAAAGWEQGK